VAHCERSNARTQQKYEGQESQVETGSNLNHIGQEDRQHDGGNVLAQPG